MSDRRTAPAPLSRAFQIRLSEEGYAALRLEAAERDETIAATARSILMGELARLQPQLLGHLVEDDTPFTDAAPSEGEPSA